MLNLIIWNNLVVHFVMATSRKHNANVCQCCGQVDRYEIVNEFVPISSEKPPYFQTKAKCKTFEVQK